METKKRRKKLQGTRRTENETKYKSNFLRENTLAVCFGLVVFYLKKTNSARNKIHARKETLHFYVNLEKLNKKHF